MFFTFWCNLWDSNIPHPQIRTVQSSHSHQLASTKRLKTNALIHKEWAIEVLSHPVMWHNSTKTLEGGVILPCSFRALNRYQLEGAKQPGNENEGEMMTRNSKQQETVDTKQCKSRGKAEVKERKGQNYRERKSMNSVSRQSVWDEGRKRN